LSITVAYVGNLGKLAKPQRRHRGARLSPLRAVVSGSGASAMTVV